MEGPLLGRAIAEERHRHPAIAAELRGHSGADRERDRRGDQRDGPEDADLWRHQVHGASPAPGATGRLSKELRHHRAEIAAFRQVVAVRAVATPHIVTGLERCADPGGDGLLADGEMAWRSNLPGLDLRDPRSIRYRNASGSLRMANEGYIDFLAQISHLRVARSTDGVNFTVDETPAIAPHTDMEEYGVEDPRATFIDGEWHITYVSVSRWGITTSLATTTDFRSFERRGVIFLPDHKDVVLFPEKIGGRYVALTRPMPQSFSRIFGIWIAFSEDLLSWGGHERLCLPRPEYWDELRTGGSAVPFRVDDGWLELYHGVDRDSRYAMGALLLDAHDPRKVLARSAQPILEPLEPFERTGLFNETIFSCGHVTLADGRIRMYYGAADSVVAAADFDVRDIVNSLEPWRGAARRLVRV